MLKSINTCKYCNIIYVYTNVFTYVYLHITNGRNFNTEHNVDKPLRGLF